MSLLKPTEVASTLRCSTATVRRLIVSGAIAAIQVGKRSRIDESELARYLRANGASAAK